MKFKVKKLTTILLIGLLLISSCSPLKLNNRKIASDDVDRMYLEKGLYPYSLALKNVIDKDGKVKVVFNLPPYTNPGGIGIVPEMIKQIDAAKISIRMSFFQFNHALVFERLKKAIDRGVKIYITTDLCYSSKLGYKEYFDDIKTYLNLKGQSGDNQVIDDGTESCETMFNHNKYMIVDYEDNANVKAWFGSFNPTNHGSVENVELAIVANDKNIAEVLKLDFDQQISKVFKVYKKGVYSVIDNNEIKVLALNDEEIKAYLKKGIKVTYPVVRVGEVEFELILSPKVKSLTRIIEEVYAANKEILFSSFAIADQMLISSIINKSNTTGVPFNLNSVLTLPHPYDEEGYNFIFNGDKSKQKVVFLKSEKNKSPTSENVNELRPIADEIKNNLNTPSNYLTPKGELKSTIKYIYPKGEVGGVINKVKVEGIFNSKVIDEKNTYQRLIDSKIPIWKSTMYGELHNKLFLIDEEKTIFGSHNFSQSAENSNDELTVIIKSKKLTQLLKDELFSKTKYFSFRENAPVPSYSGKSTLVISEVMSESSFKMNWNKKIADIGDYVEVFNYGDKPVSMLGLRIDDHYFPEKDSEKLETSTFSGYQGAIARLVPANSLNTLGVIDTNPENNILGPKKIALIVGKYFNQTFYINKFEQQFLKKFKRKPNADEYPILFTTSEYFSAVLGDSTQGLTSKDKITLYGVDGMTVIDRYSTDQKIEVGNSLERVIDIANLNSLNASISFDYQEKSFVLKNNTVLVDKVVVPKSLETESINWLNVKEGTPGIVNSNSRYVTSVDDTYTIEGEYVDVESNIFKKAYIVIKKDKIFDIVETLSNNYPTPKIKDVLIYPGLIDAHNHIKYNTMPIWKVAKTYDNRGQWPEESIYKNGIKELYKKMYMEWPECDGTDENEVNKCLAKKRCQIIRYGEIKALIGGTTSIQGSSSFDETSSDITFKGLNGYTIGSGKNITKSKARILEDLLDDCTSDLARNIEREKWHGYDEVRSTANSISSEAFAKKSINDPEKFKQTPTAKLLEEFKNKITNTFFIHLGEGKDKISKDEWSELSFLKLNVPQTTVIHGTAFEDLELKEMGEKNISLAWSPTSNLLLYKKTSNIPQALKYKVNVALGSDWSLSGTKSILYELKIAKKVNEKYFGNAISDQELLKMATLNAAKSAHLEDLIGSINKNKLADLFLVSKKLKMKTPLETLLSLDESKIDLVIVGGSPVIGKTSSFQSLDYKEYTKIKDTTCYLDLNIAEQEKDFDQFINELSHKNEDAFKSLNKKVQDGLGNDFLKLDPLCSDKDSRIINILNSL